MKKTWKRLCTGFLALATVVTALPTDAFPPEEIHKSQSTCIYWRLLYPTTEYYTVEPS